MMSALWDVVVVLSWVLLAVITIGPFIQSWLDNRDRRRMIAYMHSQHEEKRLSIR